ncbi:uncharacterized protein LOC113279884 [Papaver somniferum]|uniref:uncharacterized protein LOC113279884 n=1 Tax=Papaver somniferum TaxID=3469 RepID=UPI000E6FC9B0|nr:uncharacterized protein LOC113279884 [Papaver somniferum]
MSKSTRMKHPTNKNYSSGNDPGIVEAIRKKTKEVHEEAEVSRIAKEEEMGRIRQKNQVEKKYKRKYDLATPKPLGPRRKDGKNLNASHRNPRGTGSKAKGIIIDDPPPQAEQPTHEESDSKKPTEQEGDDREIEEEKDAKEKGKKKEGPKKKKGDHMPDPLKMFARGPDDPPLGIPGDGGKDHKDVVRIMKLGTSVSMIRKWPLEGIETTVGEVPEVIDLVNYTGLLPAVENLDLGYDRPLCSAFAERYYGETDTLHLPFGEMTITPNDVKLITCLSIEGKAVKHKGYEPELEWDKIYAWTKEVFQWDEEKTKKEMLVGKAKHRIFHLSRLMENFMGTKKLCAEGKEVMPQRIIATANAYVLYVLGAVIFLDVSGARLSANFIHLLQPFGELREYSWATAILAHSLKELRKASRSQRNQIGGNMAFLQAWIYM